eukprot:m.836038 g.836038  ORF g.836038 m.836038 type:complete len:841 (+) comp23456_c0_seq3:361-2883(+)
MSGVGGLSTMSKFFTGRRAPQNPQPAEPHAGSKIGDGYNEDIRDAMNQVIALNEVKGALMGELIDLKRVHDSTVSKLAEKTSTEELLRERVSKIELEKESLKDDLRASISKLESEKSSLASKIEETSRLLQQRTSVDEVKLKTAVEETSILRRTISELQEEINATEFGHITAQLGLKEAVKSLKSRLSESQNSNSLLENEVQEMQQKISELHKSTTDLARIKGEMFVITAERDSAVHDMQSLQDILKDKNALLEEALSDLEILKADKAKTNTVLDAKDRELKSARARISALHSEVQQLQARCTETEKMLSAAQGRNAELTAENEELSKQASKAHGDAAAAINAVQELVREHDVQMEKTSGASESLQRALELATEENRALHSGMEALKSSHDAVITNLKHDRDAAKTKLEKAMTESVVTICELQEQVEHWQQKHSADTTRLQLELTTASDKISTLESEGAAAGNIRGILDEKVSALEAFVKALERDCAAAQQRAQDSSTALAQCHDEMEAETEQHNATVTALKTALDAKSADIEDKDNQIAALTVDLNLANESREIVHKRMSLQEAENGNIMEKVKELEEQVQGQLNLSMDHDTTDGDKRLGSTAQELTLLQSSHEELNEKLRCKSTEADQFQHLYEQASLKVEDLKGKLDACRAKLDSTESSEHALESDLRVQQALLDKATKYANDLERQLEEIETDRSRLQRQNEIMREELKTATTQAGKLDHKYSTLGNQVTHAQSDADRCRKEAAETRKELDDAMEQLHAAWDELETMSAKNFSLRSELNESKDLVESLGAAKTKLTEQVENAKKLFKQLHVILFVCVVHAHHRICHDIQSAYKRIF